MTGVHARTNSVSTKSYFKRNSVRFPELLGFGKFAKSKVLLYCILIRSIIMNCQGVTEVFFTQIESNQSIVLFFKIATLVYINTDF